MGAGPAVGGRRALVEAPDLGPLAVGERAVEDVALAPARQHPLLELGEGLPGVDGLEAGHERVILGAGSAARPHARLRPERKGGAGHRRRARDRLRDRAPDAHARRLGRGRRPRRRAGARGGRADRRAGDRDRRRRHRPGRDACSASPRRSSASAGSTSPSPTPASRQPTVATVRGIGAEEWERVFEVDLLGVWRTVRAALPQIVERRGPHRRHLLRLRLRQRRPQQPLRGRQGRGRGARSLAAGRADAARGQRQRRLLRLGRHEDGPGRLRPTARRPHAGKPARAS